MKNPFSKENEATTEDLSSENSTQDEAVQEEQPVQEQPVLTDFDRLKNERNDLILQVQRLQAEFDNYRKRVERDAVDNKLSANDALLKEVVPILDNLDLAVQHAKDEHGAIKAEDLLSGAILIKDQIQNTLEHHGIEEMVCEGRFDPKMHEALMTVQKEGAERGTILQVFQRGYTRYGKSFRAAKVSVAK